MIRRRSHRPLSLLALALALAFGAASCNRPPPGSPGRIAEEAKELESRLMAPCCWAQTLDIHASPLSDELRTEIAARLTKGERSAAIEADLVARYGDRIRAVPSGFSLDSLGWPLIVAFLVAGAGVLLLGARWVRRGRAAATGAATGATTGATATTAAAATAKGPEGQGAPAGAAGAAGAGAAGAGAATGGEASAARAARDRELEDRLDDELAELE